jgi:hypothetical protein
VTRTHDLDALLNLALPHDPKLQSFRRILRTPSRFAVDFRYPGTRATTRRMLAALRHAERVRRGIRERLGLRTYHASRADLAARTKLPDDAKEHARIRQTLQHWQKDADLASIRDSDAIAKLPADEQEACKKLWADVEELLKHVELVKTTGADR